MKSPAISLLLAIMACVLSCSDESLTYDGDLFPLDDNRHWKYEMQFSCYCPDSTFIEGYDYDLMVLGDTLLNGNRYTVIGNQLDIHHIVRKVGPRYFEWNFENDEHLFLDTRARKGDTWTRQIQGTHRVGYTVLANHTVLTVKGRRYRNVFVVQERHDYDTSSGYSYTMSVIHYYAPGAGEIMQYYPKSTSPYISIYRSVLIP